MADDKGGRRGHPVKGKNVSGQYRALAAKGIIKSGKGGKTKYSRGRSKVVHGLQKRGAGKGISKSYSRQPGKGARFAIGEKAAHLRGGGGGGKPSRAERDATRVQRIAAGRQKLIDRGIYSYNEVKDLYNVGGMPGISAPRSKALGTYAAQPRLKATARERVTDANTRARIVEKYRSGPYSGTRAKRVAAGRAKAESFLVREGVKPSIGVKPPQRKEMASRYPGKYADTGKPFSAGAKIYYAESKAYSRQPRGISLANLSLGGKALGAASPRTRFLAQNVKLGLQSGLKGRVLKQAVFDISRREARRRRASAKRKGLKSFLDYEGAY